MKLKVTSCISPWDIVPRAGDCEKLNDRLEVGSILSYGRVVNFGVATVL